MKSNNLFLNAGRTIGIRNPHDDLPILFCGEGYPTRVLASVGLSCDTDDIQIEIDKSQQLISAGAEIITDHSVTGDIPKFHKMLIDNTNIPVSYLTIYELLERLENRKKILEKNMALDLLEEQAERGITLITVHATATHKIAKLRKCGQKRTIVSTSRGGAAILNLLMNSKEENVYLEFFDDVLNIFKKHNITLSLGSTFRPASVCDAGENDLLYWKETEMMGTLVKKAIGKEVPVMVEGIGHAPLHKIPQIIMKSKEICYGVPYRVLSVATDIALGYDHIASAIAIAQASLYGADLATCITRSEHIGRPSTDDIIEGLTAARIAAYCASLSKLEHFEKDYNMTKSRSKLGCRGLIQDSIYPIGAKKALARQQTNDTEEMSCSMCGKRCALINQSKLD